MMLLKKYMNSEFTPLYIIIGVLFIVFVGFEFQLYGDFSIYFAASQDLAKGINVYTYNYGTNQDLPYMASPALAYLLYPFSLLSLPVAAAIWKMANILLLYRLWILLEKHFIRSISIGLGHYRENFTDRSLTLSSVQRLLETSFTFNTVFSAHSIFTSLNFRIRFCSCAQQSLDYFDFPNE